MMYSGLSDAHKALLESKMGVELYSLGHTAHPNAQGMLVPSPFVLTANVRILTEHYLCVVLPRRCA